MLLMKLTTKGTDEIIKKIPALLAIIAVLCTPVLFAGQAETDAKSTASPPPISRSILVTHGPVRRAVFLVQGPLARLEHEVYFFALELRHRHPQLRPEKMG